MHIGIRASSEARTTSRFSTARTAGRHLLAVGLLLASMQSQAAFIHVDTLDDKINKDKACSLREAITNANNNDQSGSKACVAGEPGIDYIMVDPELGGGTIALTSTLPIITEALQIYGPVPNHAGGLTLDGMGSFRILQAEGSVPQDFTVTLVDLSFVQGRTNAIGEGGAGIWAFNTNLDVYNANVRDNMTLGTESGGAGISVREGNASLSRTTVANNTTTQEDSPGGGVFVRNGNANITGSTISGNLTMGDLSGGGGVAVSIGNIAVSNSTFSGNTTLGINSHGGGIRSINSNISLLHTTLFHNSSEGTGLDGANVHFFTPADTFSLRNSLIVHPNPADSSCSKQADVAISSLATDTSCTGIATPEGNIALGELKLNGGPTATHEPGPFSDALETADQNFCSPVDQRGSPRPFPAGKLCDIGSHEVNAGFDYGDLPTAQQSGFNFDYPTTLAENGASHALIADAPILGVLIDVEGDGQPTANAKGDDDDNLSDEDGVFFASDLIPGQDATVDVTVSNGPAKLHAWLDFNADGDFDDVDEQVFVGQPVVNGNNPGLTFAIPDTAKTGGTFARFRLSTTGELTPRGIAEDGEVEDYAVTIKEMVKPKEPPKQQSKKKKKSSSGCSLMAGSSPDPLLPLFALLAALYLARKSSRRV